MTTTLINPFITGITPLITIDDFTGSNGAAISTAIWDKTANATPTALIQGNAARLTTGTAGGYAGTDNLQIRSKTSYGLGEYRGQMILRNTSADFWATMSAWSSGGFFDYAPAPATCYYWRYNAATKWIQLWERTSEVDVQLGSTVQPTSFASLDSVNPTAGDTWNWVLKQDGTGVKLYLWNQNNSRPGTATITSSDTAHTSGLVGLGVGQAGTASVYQDFDNITFQG